MHFVKCFSKSESEERALAPFPALFLPLPSHVASPEVCGALGTGWVSHLGPSQQPSEVDTRLPITEMWSSIKSRLSPSLLQTP